MPSEVIREARLEERDACLALRVRVFVEEQGVPVSLEHDGRDGEARHLIALSEDRVVGTARVRAVDGIAKLERVAVERESRGGGLGRALVREAEAVADQLGARRLRLHAQLEAAGFYERLGYQAVGEPFLEAGLPHRCFEKPLPESP